MSKLLVRVSFALLPLYYGLFFIVYLILWIAIPKARTAKQKLEMKGEDINVSNIERSIKEEYHEIKNSRISRFMQHCEKSLATGFRMIGQIIWIFLAISLLIGSIFALLTFLTILLLPHLFPWGENFNGLAYAFTDTNLTITKTALLILGIIPIMLTIFVSIKMLFTFNSNNKIIILSALSLWVIGLIMLIFVGFSEGKTLSTDRSQYGEYLDLKDHKSLVINVNERYASPSHREKNGVYRLEKDNHVNLLLHPNVNIYPASDSNLFISVRYYTFKEAKTYDNMDFNWNVQNDTLSFDNFFDLKETWRGQRAEIYIFIPENVKLTFTPQTASYITKYKQLDSDIISQLYKDKLQFIMQNEQLYPVK